MALQGGGAEAVLLTEGGKVGPPATKAWSIFWRWGWLQMVQGMLNSPFVSCKFWVFGYKFEKAVSDELKQQNYSRIFSLYHKGGYKDRTDETDVTKVVENEKWKVERGKESVFNCGAVDAGRYANRVTVLKMSQEGCNGQYLTRQSLHQGKMSSDN